MNILPKLLGVFWFDATHYRAWNERVNMKPKYFTIFLIWVGYSTPWEWEWNEGVYIAVSTFLNC